MHALARRVNVVGWWARRLEGGIGQLTNGRHKGGTVWNAMGINYSERSTVTGSRLERQFDDSQAVK